MLRAKPNSGDLHSGSAVDSDSTCGSSILSSPTRPQPIGLRYFRGIAQLVARLVRDEEAVGSNPAAPTEKDRYTFVCRSFSISAAEATAASGRNREARLGPRSNFSRPCQGLRKNWQAQLEGGAAGQAISPVGCCLARGSQSVGMSTVGDYRYTFVCRSFSISAAGFEQQQSRPPPAAETGRRGWSRGQQDVRPAQGPKQTLGAATRVPLYYSHKSLSLSSEIC